MSPVLEECRNHWNQVAKPLHSLGLFEELVAKIGAAQGTVHPDISRRKAFIFCADNGVVDQGISQSDHTVTTAVVRSMAAGNSNVNILARKADTEVDIYDVGMIDDVPDTICRKLCHGTRDFTKEPAMTRQETEAAIEVGRKALEKAKSCGYNIAVIGEMGIGNTTTAAAVLSVLLDREPEELCGRGSGLSDAGLKNKIETIKRGISTTHPDPTNPDDVISKVGGADIAAMYGVLLEAPRLKIPVVLDGLVSAAAAVAAWKKDPSTKEYMIPSHQGREPGCSAAFDTLGLKAPIQADMALGEGTGGIMLLPMLDMALAIYNSSHSFKEIGIEPYREQK